MSQRPSDGVFAADRIVLPVFRVADLRLGTDELLVWDRPRQRLVPCPLPPVTPLLVASRTAQSEHLVRGGNPSSQDGLWMATVNPSDVP